MSDAPALSNALVDFFYTPPRHPLWLALIYNILSGVSSTAPPFADPSLL